eukprot:443532_1
MDTLYHHSKFRNMSKGDFIGPMFDVLAPEGDSSEAFANPEMRRTTSATWNTTRAFEDVIIFFFIIGSVRSSILVSSERLRSVINARYIQKTSNANTWMI